MFSIPNIRCRRLSLCGPKFKWKIITRVEEFEKILSCLTLDFHSWSQHMCVLKSFLDVLTCEEHDKTRGLKSNATQQPSNTVSPHLSSKNSQHWKEALGAENFFSYIFNI